MNQSVSQQTAHDDREQYLISLESDYRRDWIRALADLLGPGEDFDGLVTGLQDQNDTMIGVCG